MKVSADEMDHNPMVDPAHTESVVAERRNGPDFKRGRSFSKQGVNQTNLESIHSSQSMIAVEHENKGDVFNAQVQRGRIKMINLKNMTDSKQPDFKGFQAAMMGPTLDSANQDQEAGSNGHRPINGMVLSAK